MNAGNRKLKILFISSDKFPPYRPAARAIFGDELTKRGHQIDWILQAEKSCNKSYKMDFGNGIAYIGATDDGQSMGRRLRKYMLDFVNDLKIISLVRSNKYDLIQVKDKYLSALLALAAAKVYRVYFCFWLAYPHAEASLYSANKGYARYKWLYYLRGYLYRIVLYKIILPASDHIFVQSEQMKKDIAVNGIPVDKMTPIPSSMNLDIMPLFVPEADGYSPDNHKLKKLVYLGTLIRERHLDFLIRVLARVLETHPHTKLYLVGRGEHPKDEKLLRNEIERLGVSNSVVFTGQLPMLEAWEYVKSADVCLSPYFPTPILNSTSPTKLIEYMALGKPVVCNDHPEQSLVIQESGAGVCTPWTEDEFASAILRLLDNPDLAKDMGEKGRVYVEKYRTNSRMADIVENKYGELL